MSQFSPQAETLLDHAACERTADARQLLTDLAELTKVRITLMVVITAGIGYLLGMRGSASLSSGWLTAVAALAGTALACMGASTLNQVYERDTDGRMHRTRHRPIPAGRMSMRRAMLLGLVLGALGVGLLALLTTAAAAAVATATIFSYVLIYTPMKRLHSTSLIVGAVPGALPPVIGYAAATGQLGLAGWLVFAIMFIWQVPHFLAIAWLYREDYARGGFPMLPVTDPSGRVTFAQMLLWCLLLIPVSLLPTVHGYSGATYAAVAMACGLGFMACAVLLVLRRERLHARLTFFASLIYLPLVLAALVIDKV